MNKTNKKGVSPLIAAVLLIAFSVALGAIVITFTTQSTHELTDDAGKQLDRGIKCSLDLTVALFELDNLDFICYNRTGSDNFEFIVENQGSQDAEGNECVDSFPHGMDHLCGFC